MPTYVFYCDKCLKEKEFYLKHIIKDEEKKQKCDCGNDMTQEIFSPMFKHCDKGVYIQDRGFNPDKLEYNFNKKKRHEKNI